MILIIPIINLAISDYLFGNNIAFKILEINMIIKTLYPQNSILAQYIAYFYFLRATEDDFNTMYYAFPHIYSGLSIYNSTQFEVERNKLTTYSDNNKID
jgi:hypothetical protein